MLGVRTEQAVKLAKDLGDESAVIKQKTPELIGVEFLISGRIVHNDFTDCQREVGFQTWFLHLADW